MTSCAAAAFAVAAGEVALVLGLAFALLSMTTAMAQVERGANRINGIRRELALEPAVAIVIGRNDLAHPRHHGLEHAVDVAVVAAAHDVVDERLAHVADRAGAGDRLLRCDQVAGESSRDHVLVVGRPGGRPDEVPPADVLPLAEPALVAARDEDHHPLDEVAELVGWDVLPRQRLGQVAADAVDGQQCRRVGAYPEDERVGPVAPAQELAAGRGERHRVAGQHQHGQVRRHRLARLEHIQPRFIHGDAAVAGRVHLRR